MARHRRVAGMGPGPLAFVDPGPMTSHRRSSGPAGAWTAALLTAGAVAGGAAIAAATLAGSHTAPLPLPKRPTQDDHGDAPGSPSANPVVGPDDGGGPPVAIVPAPRAPEPSQVPALARASTRWRAHDEAAFRPAPSGTSGHVSPRVEHGQVTFELAPGVKRSEVEPALPALDEGDEHLVSVRVRVEHTSGHHVILRWENDGPGSSPIDLRVRDGRLVLHGGDGHPSGSRVFSHDLGPAPTGEWTHLAVRVRFSANPEKGHVSVKRDGRTVVANHHPRGGTLYPGQQSYLKAGLRRDAGTSHSAGVKLHDWHVSGVHHHSSGSSGTSSAKSSGTSSETQHQGSGSHPTTTSHQSGGGHARSSGSKHGRS